MQQGLPPNRTTPPPNPNTSIFQQNASALSKRDAGTGTDVMNPPYNISNAAGVLSDRTAYVDVVHFNGLQMYDTREYHPFFHFLTLLN